MNKAAHDNRARRRHRREKATLDHLVDRVYDPEIEKRRLPPTTESGTPVAEQIRREWDPEKGGGLPTF